MAKRKDPDRLTSLGKDYLPDPQLDEAKQLGDLYHFTDIHGLKGILKENRFLSSKASVSNLEPDFKSFRKPAEEYPEQRKLELAGSWRTQS